MLTGRSYFQEEKVYDAYYDAEEIVFQKLGMEYEMQFMDDLPFYTGERTGEKTEIIVYANGEDSSQPFDRLWIYPCTTESEAVEVLDDFEAYLGDGVEWCRNDEALSGKETVSVTIGKAVSHHPMEFWQRVAPNPELYTDNIIEEHSEVYWYACRHKTLVLVMDKVRYEYEIDGETYGTAQEEWDTEKKAFDDFYENTVDTDEFWK